MPTITLPPSDKYNPFRKIIDDLCSNMEKVLGGDPYDFLVDELQRLQDLYTELEKEKVSLENDKDAAERECNYLNSTIQELKEEISDLQKE